MNMIMNIIILSYLVCSLNHILYFSVLKKYKIILKIIENRSINICSYLHNFNLINKIGQICLCLYILNMYDYSLYNLRMYYLTTASNILYIIFGQFLNYKVFKELGINGVYYGNVFNKTTIWCYNFPFNIKWIKHPQYIGTWLTYMGIANILKILINSPLMFRHITNVQFFITITYILTAITEPKIIGKIMENKQKYI